MEVLKREFIYIGYYFDVQLRQIFWYWVLGILSPLCMYGTIPIAASFAKKGMREDWLAAFMMSSVLLNPQLMVYSAALGKTVMLVRLISCILCGITAGVCIALFPPKKSFFDFKNFEEHASHDTDSNIVLRLLKNIGRNVKATGGYFLFGILLSASLRLFSFLQCISYT